MLKKEFEKLAGYQVGYEDYCDIIEPMFESVDIPKEDFAKIINRDCFDKARIFLNELINKAKAIAEYIKAYSKTTNKEIELEEIAKQIGKILCSETYIERKSTFNNSKIKTYPYIIGFVGKDNKIHLIDEGEEND